MASDDLSKYRKQTIHDLSDDEYMIANVIINSSDEAAELCNKLATVTRHTSDEWKYTVLCAVTDYIGKDGYV